MRPIKRSAAEERGQVTAFVVVFTAALVMVAGLVIDGGLALAARVAAINHAQEAARAGAQQLDLALYRTRGHVRLDAARARTAATAYLAATGNQGVVEVGGDSVTVTVRASQPTQLLHLAGISSIHVSAAATATARRGISGPLS